MSKIHHSTIVVRSLLCTMTVFALNACGEKPAETGSSTTSETTSASSGSQVQLVAAVVEAACGECQFEMKGPSCDLAVRIDGKSYFVDGFTIDDLGDAHAKDGLCNTIRHAKVTGQVEGDRFVATAIELLPHEDDEDHG